MSPPYNVRVTATDNLGELKLSDYTARGRITVAALLSYLLGETGLDYQVHWLSAMMPSEIEDADEMPTSISVNLDHMAGSTLYEVLGKALGTFHGYIVQHGCSWLIVRETDLEYLRSGTTVTAPDGSTYDIADWGSMQDHDWWPVGYLTQTVEPAKREKVIAAPNAWIDNLLPTSATSTANAEYVEPENGDSPYYELTPWNSSQQPVASSVIFLSTGDEWTPASDLLLSLVLQTFGTLSGHAYGKKCARLYIKINGTDGSNYIIRYVTPEGGLSNDYTPAMEIVGTGMSAPEQYDIAVPVKSLMEDAGWLRISSIEVRLLTTDDEDCISRIRLFDWSLNIPEQNSGYQVTCMLNNGARGKADETEIAVSDNTDKDIEVRFVTNALKYTNAVSGHYGEPVESWLSGNIPSLPLLEFLARDYCLSIATPRLRMQGALHVPFGTGLPLLFRGGGLIYWPETFDWNLLLDQLTDISMISLPASAVEVTSVTRAAEGSAGYAAGSSGAIPSGGGTAASYFEEDGNGNVKLKDEYAGFWAAGFISAGGLNGSGGGSGSGVSLLQVWQSLTNNSTLSEYGNETQIAAAHIPELGIGKISTALSSWAGSTSLTTLGTITNGTWHGNVIPVAYGGTGLSSLGDSYSLLMVSSGGGMTTVTPNSNTSKRYLTQIGRGGGFQPYAPSWSELSLSDFLGSSTIGSSSLPVYYTGSGLSACAASDLFSGLSSNGTTNLSVTVAGQTRTITDLYAKYDGSGNIIASTYLSSSYLASWTGSNNLTTVGTLSSLAVSGATTISGETVINNTLQVGNPTTNRNMQLYGELHFNGSATAYINYISASSGIHCSVGFYSDSYISAGGVSSSSDERLKRNLRDIALTVEQIASAPAVEFDWSDGGRGVGSTAQYWQNILPEAVHSHGLYLSLEYGNVALVAAIKLARKVRELEDEIQKLRRVAA